MIKDNILLPTYTFDYSGSSYILGFNLATSLGPFLESHKVNKFFVVSEENVADKWRQTFCQSLGGIECCWIILPSIGENLKNIDNILSLYNHLIDMGIERNIPIVAFGGGVIGDLAGFAASTILRGVPFYQVPTTLLAMVDSSIGGKTGINFHFGKNMVGSFYLPKATLTDFSLLTTLPHREFSSALAEIIKIALISSKDMFEDIELWVSSGGFNSWLSDQQSTSSKHVILDIIRKAIESKIAIVSRDCKENSERIKLNLGHTIAHAIESITSYNTYKHGEAVALGMLFTVRLSKHLGLLFEPLEERLIRMFILLNLPYEFPKNLQWEDISEQIKKDKKRDNNACIFILPNSLGSVTTAHNIQEKDLKAVFQSFMEE